MYARSSTFQADPGRIGEGTVYVRQEVLPALKDTEGFIGLSMMADPATGKCIVTSAWTTEATMRASEGKAQPLRDRGAELFGAPAQVDEWEIALVHRREGADDGACVRATWTRVDAGQVERAIETYRDTLLPAIEQIDGFVSASLFVDRPSGRAVTSVTFDSRASLEASRETAATLRRSAVQENDVQILQVAEFDLTVAALRVPETV